MLVFSIYGGALERVSSPTESRSGTDDQSGVIRQFALQTLRACDLRCPASVVQAGKPQIVQSFRS